MNKDQIKSLEEWIFRSDNTPRDTIELITEWFNKNPIKPVVVGLSDEQVHQLSRTLNERSYFKHDWLISAIHNFLKTQTFAHSEIQQKYHELYNDYQSLLADKADIERKFKVNWDDAPKDSSHVKLFRNFYNESGELCSGKITFYEVRPTPPTPTVQIGQVWRSKLDAEYICNVTTLGFLPNNSEPSLFEDAVSYSFKGSVYTRTLSDFIAKFERVGGV